MTFEETSCENQIFDKTSCNVKEYGTSMIKPCVFPFKYRGKTYNHCTNEGFYDGLFWCSTLTNIETKEHMEGAGFWGFCENEAKNCHARCK